VEGADRGGRYRPPERCVFGFGREESAERISDGTGLHVVGQLVVTVRRDERRSLPCGCPVPGKTEVVKAAGA